MGYTHYWYRKQEYPKQIMEQIVTDFKKILEELDCIPLSYNGNDGFSPIITKDAIFFNGVDDDAHETFCFPSIMNQNSCGVSPTTNGDLLFDFCKTARKPYDLLVMSILIIIDHYLSDEIVISSDGGINCEWVEAKELCRRVLGYGGNFRFKD